MNVGHSTWHVNNHRNTNTTTINCSLLKQKKNMRQTFHSRWNRCIGRSSHNYVTPCFRSGHFKWKANTWATAEDVNAIRGLLTSRSESPHFWNSSGIHRWPSSALWLLFIFWHVESDDWTQFISSMLFSRRILYLVLTAMKLSEEIVPVPDFNEIWWFRIFSHYFSISNYTSFDVEIHKRERKVSYSCQFDGTEKKIISRGFRYFTSNGKMKTFVISSR